MTEVQPSSHKQTLLDCSDNQLPNFQMNKLERKLQWLGNEILIKDKALDEIRNILSKSQQILCAQKNTGYQAKEAADKVCKLEASAEDGSVEDNFKMFHKEIETIFDDLEFSLHKLSIENSPGKGNFTAGSKKNNAKVSIKNKAAKRVSSKDNNYSNDTSLDSSHQMKIYEVPVQFQTLKQLLDADVQVNLSPNCHIFERLQGYGEHQEDISSDKITFQSPKIYEIPFQIEDLEEIYLQDSEGTQNYSEMSEAQRLIVEIPMTGYSSINEKYIVEIEKLESKIEYLLEENQRIRKQKEVTRIYQIPMTVSKIEEVQIENSYLSLDSSEKEKEGRDIEIQVVEQWLPNQIISIPELVYVEIPVTRDVIVEKVVRVMEEKVIERVVKIPYLQPIQIVDKCQVIVQKIVQVPFVKASQQLPEDHQERKTANGETCMTVERSVQTEEMATSLQLIEIPVQIEIEKIREVERIVNMETVKLIEVPAQMHVPVIWEIPIEMDMVDKQQPKNEAASPQVIIRQIPVEVEIYKVIEVPVEVIKIVEVPVEVQVQKEVIKEVIRQVEVIKEVIQYIQVEKEVIKQVEKIKIKEVPLEVEIIKEVPVIQVRQVPIEVEVERVIIRQVPISIMVEKYVIKEVPVEVLVQKIVLKEVPIELVVEKQVEKMIIKEVPLEVIRQIVHEVPIQVEIQKQVQVEKLIEVIKQVQVIREVVKIVEVPVEVIKQIPVQVIRQIPIELIREVEVIKQIQTKKIVQVPVVVMIQEREVPKSQFMPISQLCEQSNDINLKHINYQGELSPESITLKSKAHDVKIFEVPIELEMEQKQPFVVEKIVYERVQVPIQIIQFYPLIQVISVEVVKQVRVPQLIEIPIELQMEQSSPVHQQSSKLMREPSFVDINRQETGSVIIEVQVFGDEEVVYDQGGAFEESNYIEKEVIVEKEVFVDKIVEVPIIVEKIVEIPMLIIEEVKIQKIVYKDKIVEVANKETNYKVEMATVGTSIDQLQQVCSSAYQDSQEECSVLLARLPIDNSPETDFRREMQLQIESKAVQFHTEQEDQDQMLLEAEEGNDNLAKYNKDENLPTRSMRIYEIPLQLHINDSFDKQRQMELRHIENIETLKSHYQREYSELHQLIENLEKMVVQLNLNAQEKQLRLEEQFLNKEMLLNEIQVNKSALAKTMELFDELKKNYGMEQKDKELHQMRIKQLDGSLYQAFEKLAYLESSKFSNNHKFSQTQREQNITYANMDIQTEDLDLFENIDVFEIPIEGAQLLEGQKEVMHLEEPGDSLQAISTARKDEEIGIIRGTPLICQIPVEIMIEEDMEEEKRVQLAIVEIPVQIVVEKETEEKETQTTVEDRFVQISNTRKQSFSFRADLQPQLFKDLPVCNEEQEDQDSPRFKQFNMLKMFKKRTQELLVSDEDGKNESQLTSKVATETQTDKAENKYPHQDELIYLEQFQSFRKRITHCERFTIVEAFECINLQFEKGCASEIKKGSLANHIMNLGSQQNINQIINSSNVQSMTPNALMMMDHSQQSQFRFPPPKNEIRDISLIRKSSNLSENKFIGSLDIREAFGNKDDPLASARLVKKRLQGFEQQQSSSDQDIDHTPQPMIIEQTIANEENQHPQSKEGNPNLAQTPNLEPDDLNFSEYGKFHTNFYQAEQKFNQKYMAVNTDAEINNLRQKIKANEIQIKQIQQKFEEQNFKLQFQLETAEKQLCQQRKLQEKYEVALQGLQTKLNEQQKKRESEQIKLAFALEELQTLRQNLHKSEKAFSEQVDKFKNVISQKQMEIKELKAEQSHKDSQYQTQLLDIKEIILQKQQLIEHLERQIEDKVDKIDHLEGAFDELRRSIALIKHDEADQAQVMEEQFERARHQLQADFEEEIQKVKNQAFDLRQQLDSKKEMINDKQVKIDELMILIKQLTDTLSTSQEQNQRLTTKVRELEKSYAEDVRYLNDEMDRMKVQLQSSRVKDESLLNGINSQEQPVRMEYLSDIQVYFSREEELMKYCKELESVILKHEQTIKKGQSEKEELYGKVVEYLKDALDREQEAEYLYAKMVDLQNALNSLLLEKTTLEVQNKRLLKVIDLSEKKIGMLGNRLIEMARDRASYDSDGDNQD